MRQAQITVVMLLFVFCDGDLSALPQFTNSMVRGTSIILSGSNGSTNPDFELLTSTNLALPLGNWTAASTNTFAGSGHFTLTNPMNVKVRQQFFVLQTLPAENDLWVPTCGAWLGAAVSNAAAKNFTHEEAGIGRPLDVMRFYHSPGSWTSLSSEELSYINAGRRLLESIKPNSQWSNAVGVANGGSATVDSQITSLAKSIAGVKPMKLMLIVWHEPENDVVGPGLPGKAGTPQQYVEMWHNVRSIFNANGATNVIWCTCNETYDPYIYLTPSLWPGNSYVDWALWDEYQTSASDTFTNVLQGYYNWMSTNSTSSNNYLSKPWGLAEWGIDDNPTVAEQTNAINGMNDALNLHNQFPKLKLVEYFDEESPEVLSNAVPAYSNFANSSYMEQQCPY